MTENEAKARFAIAVSFALENYAADLRKIDEPIPYKPAEPEPGLWHGVLEQQEAERSAETADTEPPAYTEDHIKRWAEIVGATVGTTDTEPAPATSIAVGVSVDPATADAFDDIADKLEDDPLESKVLAACETEPLTFGQLTKAAEANGDDMSRVLKSLIASGQLETLGERRGKRYRTVKAALLPRGEGRPWVPIL